MPPAVETRKHIGNPVVEEDLAYIYQSFKEKDKLKNATILVTGCAGFLGYYFLQLLTHYASELKLNSIIGVDNFKLGRPAWVDALSAKSDKLQVNSCDVCGDEILRLEGLSQVNYVIHMASIASPAYYRQYPIETMDANIWGLRRLLEYFKDKNLKGFLFFSSSEIYGDPDAANIPTKETYRGSVSCVGPRACYDESKRFGETLCYNFANQYAMPIGVARPFNNYGPGLRIDDKRVVADFAKAVLENKDIVILSDGAPTRTFCYVADALIGYLKVLTHGAFDYFNIGIDRPEISVKQLAEIYAAVGKKILGYTGKVVFQSSKDKDYLTDNPNRRCPDISKARSVLDFHPTVDVHEGVQKFLKFLHAQKGQVW